MLCAYYAFSYCSYFLNLFNVFSKVMAPCKQWMQLSLDNRVDQAYLDGVQKFLDYAFQRSGKEAEIRCPCYKCCNTTLGTRETIDTHLKVYGIIQNYNFWYHHREHFGELMSNSENETDDEVEGYESEDEVQELLKDLYLMLMKHSSTLVLKM